LDPHESALPPLNGLTIGSAVFTQLSELTRVRNTETDRHASTYVAICRIYAIMRAMWTKNFNVATQLKW